ncbi:NAD(P)/FAD-dependent oxidoreductase [Chitinibacter fontanus]|uniref:NAD(P)/FAD-dependent oxidoreductase n=1 Tax=Chitinibacter fontanus TaxID=1737446 RepID=A0A7D5ZFN2_9NEIS|nr:NAD(P)/FAD-dependent oxidoreductase [Chitinibacter fontanus]QLI80989.1 NAD(P)/FAD-dependent oxidoreductase [Chitinibacter fontanus]
MNKHIIIIGAGPAGLTAAYELQKLCPNCKLTIIEADTQVGGISKTVQYNGNRMDLGGHRFFSKSAWVMQWWASILPMEGSTKNNHIKYQNQTLEISPFTANNTQIDSSDKFLLRPRLSRIYFLRKLFDYPIKLNSNTIKNLGIKRILKIGISYLKVKTNPIKNESSLEDFIINRFGQELYLTFFKNYTEKVWGVPCNKISADWGAQRIKGLSITATLKHAINKLFNQKHTAKNTSLIEQFLYPNLGPGQMWEKVADKITKNGGSIYLNTKVTRVYRDNQKITSVEILKTDGSTEIIAADEFISTMPVRELVNCTLPTAPDNVLNIAQGLMYRDFLTVGLEVKTLNSPQKINGEQQKLNDNWIYIQEPDVKIGRLQIFNNWSPDLVKNKTNYWLGLEYFCQEGDEIWSKNNADMISFASAELEKIGLINQSDVIDGTVVHVPKAYPAYFGTYIQFDTIKKWTLTFNNLYLIGRNGMHRYNNQDHSMLTAKLAAESIANGIDLREEIWKVNLDDEYHEEK